MIFILFALILYKIIFDEEEKRYIRYRDMKQKREIALQSERINEKYEEIFQRDKI